MENFTEPKKISKHRRLPVYQFDIQGNLIYKHETTLICSENVGIGYKTLRSLLRRKNCYEHKWYFSRSKDFKISVKKGLHNPLFSRNKDFVPLDVSYEEDED